MMGQRRPIRRKSRKQSHRKRSTKGEKDSHISEEKKELPCFLVTGRGPLVEGSSDEGACRANRIGEQKAEGRDKIAERHRSWPSKKGSDKKGKKEATELFGVKGPRRTILKRKPWRRTCLGRTMKGEGRVRGGGELEL